MGEKTLRTLDNLLDALIPQAARALMKCRVTPRIPGQTQEEYEEWCATADRIIDELPDEKVIEIAMGAERKLEEDRERAEYERLKEEFEKEVIDD